MAWKFTTLDGTGDKAELCEWGDVVKCKRKFVVDMNKRMPCIVMTTAGSYFSEK